MKMTDSVVQYILSLLEAEHGSAEFRRNELAETIGCVLGHGTGTIYNDSMEIAAIRSVLGDHTPLASVKANCGHTLGASGILQAVLALEVLRRKELFPQAGLRNPERGAERMVSAEIQPVCTRRILSLNSGFGGINAALALEALE